jgi:hypothetical protein
MMTRIRYTKIFVYTLIGFWLAFSSSAAAQSSIRSTQAGIIPVPVPGSIQEKILIAIASGALSFLSGYILLELKERRTPKKRLSYDLTVKKGLVIVDDEISDDISLYYKGKSAGKLSYVRVDIKNTGSTVVKNEFIRFSFNDDSKILNIFHDPIPPPEIGISEIGDEPNNHRYKISHIERQQCVSFCFIVESPGEVLPEMHPFNEEGDVEFTASSIAKEADEQTKLERFIYFSILWVFISVWASVMPGGEIFFTFFFAIFSFSAMPLIRPVARIIAATLLSMGQSGHPTLNIENDKEGLVTVNIDQSRNKSG